MDAENGFLYIKVVVKLEILKGEIKMSAKLGSFEKNGKSYATLELADQTNKYRFNFGLTKARLILNHIEEIEKFVTTELSGAEK